MARILIVDDEPSMRRILASNLRQDKHLVWEASGAEEARQALLVNTFDVVFTDQKMPDGEGLAVLAAALETDAAISVVLLTVMATIELAVESVRQGAFDFLTEPFQPDVVRATARRAAEHTQLLRENVLLKHAMVCLEGTSEIHGQSHAMRSVRDKITRVATTSTTVLITGETGTGKELVARAIHRNSQRAGKPFIPVNCAAFTETLLESELFGHEKGAFTGADRARQGLFEAANQGTLFLDEAGEMSLAAQAKLLRALKDGQVSRVGSTKPRPVDVRVLVATHRDLKKRAEEGLFREDLYYRLAVVPIHIPSLRERADDIPELCAIFCRQVATELAVAPRRINQEAVALLQRYAFPGNLRELKNMIERAYILSSNEELGPEDLPLARTDRAMRTGASLAMAAAVPTSAENYFDLTALLKRTEKDLIIRTLAASGGNQAEAARRMGLSRSALGYKLSKYGITNVEHTGRVNFE